MKHILALAGLLALAACGRGAKEDAQTLHVGSQRGGTKALMLASGALDGAPYKVEWSEFPASQHLLEAISGGAVDIGLVGDAPFLFAYQNGSRVRAVGAQQFEKRVEGQLALVVPQNSKARTLADLKNKTVGITRGSIGHYLVIKALQAAQLPPDWVKLTFLPPGDAKAAFDSGSIDAWAIWTPYLTVALKGHAHTITDSRNLVKTYGLEAANEDAILSKGPLIRDFLKREAKALRWADTHVEDYAQVLSKETGLPIDIARDFATKSLRQPVPIDDPIITDLSRVLDDFKGVGAVEGKRDLASAFDRSLFKTESTAAR